MNPGKLLRFFLVVPAVFLLFACEDKSGACEVRIEVNDYYIYSCRDEEDDNGCSIEQDGVDKVFHKGSACASLGYTHKTSSGSFSAEEDDLTTPGDDGAFKDDVSVTGGCSGGYQGPSFDIQIDSQCQAAFIYRCNGADQAADAACSIYQTYKRDNPSIPSCPYCD